MGRFGTAADGAMLFELRAIEDDIAYNPADFAALARRFMNQQLEADAARRLRVRGAIQTALLLDRRKVATMNRLRRQLTRADVSLAANMIDAEIAALPPLVAPAVPTATATGGVKRKRDDG
jgi:hypothetical protein